MEILVTGCDDCPFKYSNCDGWSTSECRHPKGDYRLLENVIDGITYGIKDGETPDWCPLKKEEITIKLFVNHH